MAEHIAGTEQAFVEQMNERAKGLGMKNTHFVDCCGLTESVEHYTTPYDIALMSRELISRYPEVLTWAVLSAGTGAPSKKSHGKQGRRDRKMLKMLYLYGRESGNFHKKMYRQSTDRP